jgi:hypothetical protein
MDLGSPNGGLMKLVIKNSACKHGISEYAMRTCLLNLKSDIILDEEPEKRLFVGFDESGNPLEIIGLIEDDTLIIIHAMKLRKQFYELLKG